MGSRHTSVLEYSSEVYDPLPCYTAKLLACLPCGMSVFTATTTYNFVADQRKLFKAGCACWIPGGAFCVVVSGENWGPVKGRLLSSFRWKLGPWEGPSRFFFLVKTVAPRRAVLFLPFSENCGPEKGRFVFLFLLAEQRAGDADDLWRSRLRCD
jgi:hypothetical protein